MASEHFLEVELQIPDAAWRELAALKADQTPVEPGFWGFADAKLEKRFTAGAGDASKGKNFEALVQHFASGKVTGRGEVKSKNGTSSIRIVALLGNDAATARGIAALIAAAASRGGEGHASIVADGDGVRVSLAKGKLSRQELFDAWDYSERLGEEIFE